MTKFSKRLLNVYTRMAANNKTQMVLDHDNIIIVSNAACDVSSAVFHDAHSSDYGLILHNSRISPVVLSTAVVDSSF